MWSLSCEKGLSALAVFLYLSSTSPEGTGVKEYKETAWQLLRVQRGGKRQAGLRDTEGGEELRTLGSSEEPSH